MTGEKVLVVEDEADIQELIRFNLAQVGYRVDKAATGEEALKAVRRDPPGLVLLDLMLPGISGLEVCRLLRADARTENVPVIMLTARGEESDVVAGLNFGADDYITKPFSIKVLLARVAAAVRRGARPAREQGGPLRIAGLELHQGRREAKLDGALLELTRAEFDLLHLLAARPGWVFTRRQIVDAVHGADYPVTERSVDVQVVGLRRKLGGAGQNVETVRGVGYRFKE